MLGGEWTLVCWEEGAGHGQNLTETKLNLLIQTSSQYPASYLGGETFTMFSSYLGKREGARKGKSITTDSSNLLLRNIETTLKK